MEKFPEKLYHRLRKQLPKKKEKKIAELGVDLANVKLEVSMSTTSCAVPAGNWQIKILSEDEFFKIIKERGEQ